MRAMLWNLVLGLGLASPTASAPDAECTGIGTTVGITLICSGTCSVGNCESRGDGMDGKGAFTYCGCFEDDYDTCCTVVIRDGIARPRGTCPPCGASGMCRVENNPNGELSEPVCGDPKAARRTNMGAQ